MSSPSKTSKQRQDDRVGDNSRARAGCVTRSPEVTAARQTTVHRHRTAKGLLYRGTARAATLAARAGNEPRWAGGDHRWGRDHHRHWLRTTTRRGGLGAGPGSTPAITSHSGLQEGSLAFRAAREACIAPTSQSQACARRVGSDSVGVGKNTDNAASSLSQPQVSEYITAEGGVCYFITSSQDDDRDCAPDGGPGGGGVDTSRNSFSGEGKVLNGPNVPGRALSGQAGPQPGKDSGAAKPEANFEDEEEELSAESSNRSADSSRGSPGTPVVFSKSFGSVPDCRSDLAAVGGAGEGVGGAGGSILSSPAFRRLESRRGSSVTFILPAHVSSGEGSCQSLSQYPEDLTEEGFSLQERFYELYSRRMSAPELPPIADRERPRPPSRSTSKSSLNQLTAAVNSKNFYSRLTGGSNLPRNHSDSSLKGLLMSSQGPTKSSGSVSSYISVGAGGGGGGGVGGGRGTPSAGDIGLPPAHMHRSASRALSWCATDNSAGSIPKLETLFERKNIPPLDTAATAINNHNNNNNTTGPLPATPPPQVLRNHNNNNNIIKAPNNNVIPPRSVSVNGIRGSDSQELAKLKSRKKRLQSECGAGEVETLGTIEQFGRLRVNSNGMRRSSSDNKLVDRKNVRNARLNSSRHLSVGRTDKLTSRRSSKHGGGGAGAASYLSTSKGGMRRVSSVSAINTLGAPNNRARLDSNQDSENVDGGVLGAGSDDSEEEEERRDRIREWLLGLDCADAPPEPEIDYADDPPQTDTALHIVYQESS